MYTESTYSNFLLFFSTLYKIIFYKFCKAGSGSGFGSANKECGATALVLPLQFWYTSTLWQFVFTKVLLLRNLTLQNAPVTKRWLKIITKRSTLKKSWLGTKCWLATIQYTLTCKKTMIIYKMTSSNTTSPSLKCC